MAASTSPSAHSMSGRWAGSQIRPWLSTQSIWVARCGSGSASRPARASSSSAPTSDRDPASGRLVPVLPVEVEAQHDGVVTLVLAPHRGQRPLPVVEARAVAAEVESTAARGIATFVTEGIEAAMNAYNAIGLADDGAAIDRNES